MCRSARGTGDTIGDVIARRYNRRDMMRGALGVTAAAALFGPALLAGRAAGAEDAPDRFPFAEVGAGVDETHHVAEGYQARHSAPMGRPALSRLAAIRSVASKAPPRN